MPSSENQNYTHAIESLLSAHAPGFSSSADGGPGALAASSNATDIAQHDLQVDALGSHGVGFGRQLYYLTGRAVKTMLRNPFSTYAMIGQTVCAGALRKGKRARL